MTDKLEIYTPINIETLILVAIWEPPFIFQGSFKIMDQQSHIERFIFYRCECTKREKTDILEDEFSPYDYQFTHLYRTMDQVQPEFLEQLTDDALYLLKYALNVSLSEMIRNNKQYLTYIDEVALNSISKRIGIVLKNGIDVQEESHLGFAVAMDFNPTESIAQEAVSSLLG